MGERKHPPCACGGEHYGKGLCRRHYMAEWKRTNAAAVANYERSYYEANAASIQAVRRRCKTKKRYPRSKEERQLHKNTRRARKYAADGAFTRAEWRQLQATFRHACAACGSTGPLEPDHIIPLSLGGADHIWNIQPLCRDCNGRKNHFRIAAWVDQKLVFELWPTKVERASWRVTLPEAGLDRAPQPS